MRRCTQAAITSCLPYSQLLAPTHPLSVSIYVPRSTIHNSKMVVTIQMSVSGWMEKHNRAYPCNGIVFSRKKGKRSWSIQVAACPGTSFPLMAESCSTAWNSLPSPAPISTLRTPLPMVMTSRCFPLRRQHPARLARCCWGGSLGGWTWMLGWVVPSSLEWGALLDILPLSWEGGGFPLIFSFSVSFLL